MNQIESRLTKHSVVDCFSKAMRRFVTLFLLLVPLGAYADPGQSLFAQVEELQAQVATLEGQVVSLIGQLNTHTGNASAHHAPYTNAGAISAVGPHFSGNHADLSNVTQNQHHVPAASELDDLLDGVSRGVDPNTGEDTLTFSGMNLQIVNGAGNNAWIGTGNLIIGYNQLRGDSECPDGLYCDRRGGSHMLVIGDQNNYTRHGGMVVGLLNETNGTFASVSGGLGNLASNHYASVSGGFFNTASGFISSVSGGQLNIASGGCCVSQRWEQQRSQRGYSVSQWREPQRSERVCFISQWRVLQRSKRLEGVSQRRARQHSQRSGCVGQWRTTQHSQRSRVISQWRARQHSQRIYFVTQWRFWKHS